VTNIIGIRNLYRRSMVDSGSLLLAGDGVPAMAGPTSEAAHAVGAHPVDNVLLGRIQFETDCENGIMYFPLWRRRVGCRSIE
jgi:hypothetical protein